MEKRAVTEMVSVLEDEVIALFKLAAEGKECFLRRIEVWVEEKQEVMVFVTNHLTLAASTIAAIYKERWEIELFCICFPPGEGLDAMSINLRVQRRGHRVYNLAN